MKLGINFLDHPVDSCHSTVHYHHAWTPHRMSSCTFSFECHPSPLQCQPLECCLDCHSFQLGKVHKQQGIASADASSGLASPEQLQWMTFKSSSCATFLFVNDWNQLITFFFSHTYSIGFIPLAIPIHTTIWKYTRWLWKFVAGDVGGSISGATDALPVATFLLKVTWRIDNNVSSGLGLPPKRLIIRSLPRCVMSSEELFPRMNVLARAFITGSDFSNLWKNGFFQCRRLLTLSHNLNRHAQTLT